MSSRPARKARSARRSSGIAAAALALAACGGGGGGGTLPPTLTAAFTESATPRAADRVKILGGAVSGTRTTVHVAVFGPTTSADFFSWSFDIVIGDPTVVRFVPGGIQAGNSLTPCPGQTVGALATQAVAGDGTTRVVVGVTKLGSCNGNRVSTSEAIVATLTFEILRAGTSTLRFASDPAAVAQDPSGGTIATISFDGANATLTGQ